MIRHERTQSPENLVYYTYNIFEPFSSQITCVTSTRLGGVSEEWLHSLNLSFRVGDDEQHVIANRSRLYNAIQVDADRVAQAQLVHGNHIEVVENQSPMGLYEKFAMTDGLVTDVVNYSLFIPVADCAAVAFYDPQRHVVGMLHSGWKGVIHRIIPTMVEFMHDTYGSDPTDIFVGISPCLGPCCYEVRQDFITTFMEALPTKAGDFFVPQADDTIHFDMWAALRWQLQESGILLEQVEGPAICTACSVNEFYSHRKEHGKTGRFASIIVLHA